MVASVPLLTLEALGSAGRDLPVPFAVQVPGGDGVLHLRVTQILRLLPGRRLAAEAWLATAPDENAEVPIESGDQVPVLLKLFFGAGAAKYCTRERAGHALLAQAQLPTPECIAEGEQVLLYRWLDDAQPVAEADAAQIDRTVETVGTLHRAGLLQTDMHLHNFLWHDDKVWCVDPDGIRDLGSGVGARDANLSACRDNLAVLFAQLPPTADVALAPRLMRYCQGADLAMDSAQARRLATQLPGAVERARNDRVARYLNKTMRDCTEFCLQRTGLSRLLCLRSHWSPTLEAFARDPEALLHNATVIKAGNTATVMRVDIDGHPRIVKRYNIKNPLHRLRQTLRAKSRAERAWRNGHRLRFLRIPTAQPIALLETRRFGMRDVAYLVTEDLGQLDLHTELQQQPLSEQRLQQIAQLFEALKLARLRHGDTKATNLLVHENALYLIDLDSMRPSLAGFDRDRARFAANWPADSTIGAQVRARLGL